MNYERLPGRIQIVFKIAPTRGPTVQPVDVTRDSNAKQNKTPVDIKPRANGDVIDPISETE